MGLTILQVGRSQTTHVVTHLLGTGITVANPFVKPAIADNADLLVATVVLDGSFTALVFNLEISTDNGGSWQVVTSWDAHATPSTTFQIAENTLYRFNCTTFTPNVGTTANVYVSTTSFESLLSTAYSGYKFLASPANGSSGALTPRAIVPADLPSNPTPTFATVGLPSVVKTSIKVNVNSAALLAQPTPISILPTPGPNKLIVIDDVIYQYKHVTIPYTIAHPDNNLSLVHHGKVTNLGVFLVATGLLDQAANVIAWQSWAQIEPAILQTDSVNLGVDLLLQGTAPGLTLGDGTLEIVLTYAIIDLS